MFYIIFFQLCSAPGIWRYTLGRRIGKNSNVVLRGMRLIFTFLILFWRFYINIAAVNLVQEMKKQKNKKNTVFVVPATNQLTTATLTYRTSWKWPGDQEEGKMALRELTLIHSKLLIFDDPLDREQQGCYLTGWLLSWVLRINANIEIVILNMDNKPLTQGDCTCPILNLSPVT